MANRESAGGDASSPTTGAGWDGRLDETVAGRAPVPVPVPHCAAGAGDPDRPLATLNRMPQRVESPAACEPVAPPVSG